MQWESLNKIHCCYFVRSSNVESLCKAPVNSGDDYKLESCTHNAFSLLEKRGTELSSKSKTSFCLLVCFHFRRVPWLPIRLTVESDATNRKLFFKKTGLENPTKIL